MFSCEGSPVDSLLVTGEGSGPCFRRLAFAGGDRREWRVLLGSTCSPCDNCIDCSVSNRPGSRSSGTYATSLELAFLSLRRHRGREERMKMSERVGQGSDESMRAACTAVSSIAQRCNSGRRWDWYDSDESKGGELEALGYTEVRDAAAWPICMFRQGCQGSMPGNKACPCLPSLSVTGADVSGPDGFPAANVASSSPINSTVLRTRAENASQQWRMPFHSLATLTLSKAAQACCADSSRFGVCRTNGFLWTRCAEMAPPC